MKTIKLKLLNSSTGKFDVVTTLEFKTDRAINKWLEDHDFYEYKINKGKTGHIEDKIYSLEPTFIDQVLIEIQ